jgi:type IV secretory pathway ATPase VirB11/archaellum biosynthesis ATPase
MKNEEILLQHENLSSQSNYKKLAMAVCEILHIKTTHNDKLETLLHKIENWTKNMPYFSTPQKEIIETTIELLDAIRKKSKISEIQQKIKELDDKVSFARDFD